jgi:hypothetical protein
VKELRSGVLKWLDTGSEEISIMYKGNGYGSRTSLCLTLLFVGSFVAFLFFFNVLSLSTSTTIYKLASTEDYSYEFGRD